MDRESTTDLFDLANYNPKKLDTTIKKGIRSAAENFASIVVVIVIVMIFARVFFGVQFKDYYKWATWGDIILVVLYSIVVQNTMGYKGDRNGKLDPEYITAQRDYTGMRDRIRAAGSPKIEEYCDHYINNELLLARRSVLSYTPINYDMWEEQFSGLTARQIKKLPKLYIYTVDGREKKVRISQKTKVRLIWLYNMEPVDITPEKLMTEFANRMSRGNLPLSPAELNERNNKMMTVNTVIMAAISGFIAWELISKFSAPALMSAFMTLFVVVYRGFVAYTKHYVAYSVRGPNYFNRQIEILAKYEAWMKGEQVGANEESSARR